MVTLSGGEYCMAVAERTVGLLGQFGGDVLTRPNQPLRLEGNDDFGFGLGHRQHRNTKPYEHQWASV